MKDKILRKITNKNPHSSFNIPQSNQVNGFYMPPLNYYHPTSKSTNPFF